MVAAYIKRTVGKVRNKDILEGIICGALYVAMEGGISDAEADQLQVSLASHAALDDFTISDKANILGRFREQANKSPRMAEIQFRKEVEEAIQKGGAEIAITIPAIALDVADTGADGLSDAEKQRVKTLCSWCKISPSEFGLA